MKFRVFLAGQYEDDYFWDLAPSGLVDIDRISTSAYFLIIKAIE
jgi:hypothetical protein